jgi:hypothetical protein
MYCGHEQTMDKSHLIIKSKDWRERAQDARNIANGLDDAELKYMFLEMARGYEHLAEQAEEFLSRV